MRIIKLALISFVLIALLFTGISFLFPSHIRISKAINIGAPANRIVPLLSDTTQWPQWHPAFASNMQTSSNLVIKPIQVTDSLVQMQMSNGSKQHLLNGWQLYHHQGTDSITVQWYMDFHLQWYPWQKFGSLFYEPTYGSMMETGLQNLKKAAEN